MKSNKIKTPNPYPLAPMCYHTCFYILNVVHSSIMSSTQALITTQGAVNYGVLGGGGIILSFHFMHGHSKIESYFYHFAS